MGFFGKIFGGLKKTASAISGGIASIFTGEPFDDEFYEDLESILLLADIGTEAAEQIIKEIKEAAKKEKIKTERELKLRLSQCIVDIMGKVTTTYSDKSILMIIGVNGAGKTTSIGKLANYFKKEGKSVLLIAGDTFRAAATEQLNEWAGRVDVRIVKQGEGADPASVIFDGLTSAKAKGEEIVIIDTAGRLHNKSHLMDELKKIDRVVSRVSPDINYSKLLVLDATTGANALSQVEYFNEAVGIDGIILTKLDGTAKGGVVIAIKKKYNLPVVFVGVGEKTEDLIPFNAKDFANAIVGAEQ
jgi:fused signal recognition particle receptor